MYEGCYSFRSLETALVADRKDELCLQSQWRKKNDALLIVTRLSGQLWEKGLDRGERRGRGETKKGTEKKIQHERKGLFLPMTGKELISMSVRKTQARG